MPRKIKINFKMPPESVAEKMYRKHQELRKKSGLPDPEHYKNLAAQKQKEIDAMKNEDIEHLEEISTQLKTSYRQKAIADIRALRPHAEKGEYKDLAKNVMKKRQAGVNRSVKEETEQLEEMPESSMKTRDVHAHLKKTGWSLKRTGGGHDVYSHPKSDKHIAVPRHKQLKAPLIRGILKTSKVSEETEIEEQLHKKGRFVSEPVKKPFKSVTIVSPVKEAKDEREYGYEGDMALNQLATLTRCAEMIKDLLKPDTDMPEWVQSKITLATDYIQTAADYMYSEMKEEVELDEIAVVKTNKPIGTRVADIGPGGKEYNVRTDKAYDDAQKKKPQGASFATQRRKERLASSGRMDEEDTIQEGRPSQRHPLEGHEYHKKTNDQLEYIGKDAHKAAEAMKGHNTTAENKYRDQANDAATVRYFRKKSGTPDWYKKKYGHMKEDVEQLDEKNEPTNPALWSKAKSLAKQKFDVYPSAYANGWAAKWYKEKGGGWKSVSESVNEAADDETKPVLSRKAQIVKDAARKKDNSEKFQKDPELSSEIHKT